MEVTVWNANVTGFSAGHVARDNCRRRLRETNAETSAATAIWLLAVVGLLLAGSELALVGSLRHKG